MRGFHSINAFCNNQPTRMSPPPFPHLRPQHSCSSLSHVQTRHMFMLHTPPLSHSSTISFVCTFNNQEQPGSASAFVRSPRYRTFTRKNVVPTNLRLGRGRLPECPPVNELPQSKQLEQPQQLEQQRQKQQHLNQQLEQLPPQKQQQQQQPLLPASSPRMINAGLSTVEIDIDAVDNYDNDDDQCHVAPDLKGSEADLNDGSKSFPFIALFHHVLISQSLSLSVS